MTGAWLLTRYSGEAANKERDKEYENMKILVIGAKGFVGKNLCAALKNIKDGKDRRFPIASPLFYRH